MPSSEVPAASHAGYSGTPLPKKLGLKPNQRVLFVEAPPELPALLGPLPAGCVEVPPPAVDPVDLLLLFATRSAALETSLARWVPRLAVAGALWIAWPKKAARVATDLSDGEVRRRGLATGLVDVKVCAISEIWSGLKFVRRLADRPS